MRRKWMSCVMALGLAVGGATRSEAELPAPLVTSAAEFDIPFRVAAGERVELVQLLVSTDQGRHWQVAETIGPQLGAFPFRAPFDGEFWFAIRTMDQRGKTEPVDPPTVELRVIVRSADRVRPAMAEHPVDAPREQMASAQIELAPAEARREPFPTPRGTARPRMVNSRAFELDYLDPVGGPVRQATVWWTRDGGGRWEPYAIDEDGRSPARVEVDTDGLYGFTIVLDGDRPGATPRDGEAPGIWIGVDTVPPAARLLSIEREGAFDLAVRWEAHDERLGLTPITLAYRGEGELNWRPLASNLPNLGWHTARITARWPERMELRLEVRDEAGNVRTVTTHEAIDTRLRTVSGPARGVADRIPQSRWYQVLR